jgi:autotransporter-associated beta strand protein
MDVHLTTTNVDQAQALGFTGAGVRIGLLDTGVNADHPTLSGRVTEVSGLINAQNDSNVGDANGRGTAMAQIIAGRPMGDFPGGIAPDAQIVSARILPDSYQGESLQVEDPEAARALYGRLWNDYGVRIFVNAWDANWNDDAQTDLQIFEALSGLTASGEGLMIVAAGDSGSNLGPSRVAGLPAQARYRRNQTGDSVYEIYAGWLEEGWLVVSAIDDDLTTLAEGANACGSATQNYCMVAPGHVGVTGAFDSADAPTYAGLTGTPAAAAQVAGAAALVAQAFPGMNMHDVRNVLLSTATDLGQEGVDNVFGWGLLDAGKAVRGPARTDTAVQSNLIPELTANVGQGVTWLWSNDITGAGGISTRGAGTLILAGDNDYSGGTGVNEGALQAHRIRHDASVGYKGTLMLSGDGIIDGSLSNLGGDVVLDGTLGGVTHILGDMTFLSYDLYGAMVERNIPRLSMQLGHQLQVGGTLSFWFDPFELHVSGVLDGYVFQDHQVMITAGSVTDLNLVSEAPTVSFADGLLLQGSLSFTDTEVILDLQRMDVAATAAMFGNITPASLASAQRVEAAFDGIDGGADVSADFLKGAGRIQSAANEEVAKASLRSLSGEMHARADAMTFDSLDASRRAVSMRFSELAGKPQLQGEWSRHLDEPGQGFVGNAAFSTNGWMSGGDLRFGADTVVGFAFGENEGEGVAGPGDRARQKQTQMQLYAGGARGNAYALGQLGAGQYRRQLRRGLQLGAYGESVATDYGGNAFTAMMEMGYNLGAIVPYAGVDYLQLRRDGFSEAGGSGFGLKSDGGSAERVQAVAGLRAQKRWGRAGVHGFAEWQQSLSETGLYAEASFVGVESWSPLRGEGFNRSVGMFGFGVDARLGRRTSWSFGYDQRVGSAFDDRQWSTKLRYGF